MTDSQNAHNPDKTQPMAAMPAAPSAPTPPSVPDKNVPAAKSSPAQMDLLKPAPAEPAPAPEKHHPDKTQPLHAIPPATLTPATVAQETAPPPVVPPPSQAEVTKSPTPPPASSTSPPPSRAEPAKPAPAKIKPPRPEIAKSPAATPPAPQPSSNAIPPSQKEWPKAPATPKAASASETPNTASATAAPVHIEAPKVTAAHATPSQNEAPKVPATPTAAVHGEAAPKPASAPAAPVHIEAPKAPAAQGGYLKTVKMEAAAPVTTPDELVRTATPSTTLSDRLRRLGQAIASTALVAEIMPGAAAKMRAYGALTRLDKPIGIWLLLWPVLWALWLSSGGNPDPHVFIVFVLGTVLTRSAGCAINDFADRNFDGHVKRTRDRPLVTGAVAPAEAVLICAGLGLIALGLALTLNQLAQLLTLIGGVLVVTYPFFKRFFPLPQMYLGIAFTWSVPMAYAAQTGALPRTAWVMFMSGLLWTVAYDTMYAMVDREDDKKLGIRSSALLFGDADRFIIGIMQLMTLLGLWLIGDEMELGLWYGLGLAFAAMFALYQQLLIRQRKPEDCFRAFLNNNYFGMSVFIGILLEYTFR